MTVVYICTKHPGIGETFIGIGTVAEIRASGCVLCRVEGGKAGLHCITCQCNKFPPTPPVPGNPKSKSWHDNSEPKA